MEPPFHAGELAVQERAGVAAAALRVGGIIDAELHPRAAPFLAAQRLAVLGAADADGRMWASALAGAPGFLRALDPHTLHAAAPLAIGDPLADTLAAAGRDHARVDAGMLVIDLATRRRLRINGLAEPAADGGVVIRVRQTYWNCPRYIQARVAYPRASAGAEDGGGHGPRRAARLSDAQRAWIAAADTFFIATANPADGADASHRGGDPGFIVSTRDGDGGDVLVFPDYPGNNMFNTLGNLAVNPAAGVLFIDFERGATLQLTGTAEVLWDHTDFAAFPGAGRAVRFRVAEAVELPRAVAPRWHLLELSPFNPPPPASPG